MKVTISFGRKPKEVTAGTRLVVFVFWTAFQSLLLEVLLTRIYSATIWYHYSFLAISAALTGLSIGSILAHLGSSLVGFPSIVAGISASISFLLAFLALVPASLDAMPSYVIASTIPFVLIGFLLAKAYKEGVGRVTLLYFSDLLGASTASAAAMVLLYILDPQTVLLTSSALGAVLGLLASIKRHEGAIHLSRNGISLVLVAPVLGSALLGFHMFTGALGEYSMPLKDLDWHLQRGGELLTTIWNPVSRVDVFKSDSYMPGTRAWILIDAAAGTPILDWDGQPSSAEYVKEWILYLPFTLSPKEKVLVIGPGGGPEVVVSIIAGSKSVTAVEINPSIVEVVRSFGEKAGNVYSRPEVDVVVDEARSFLSRSKPNEYDLIYMTLTDTWAAISLGGYSLAETYLYTVEAFELMLTRLSDEGVLALVRWDGELPKLVLTICRSLERIGVPNDMVNKHIAILAQTRHEVSTGPGQVLILLKRSPFTSEESSVLLEKSHKYDPIYVHGFEAVRPYDQFFTGQMNEEELKAVWPGMKFDPVSDDDPYYFVFEKGVPRQLAQSLLVAVGMVALVGLITVLARKASSGPKGLSLHWLVYFGLLGLGFMLAEMTILQKLILFIGYPSIALAAILFFLLASSALGSILSSKIRWKLMPATLGTLCIAIGLASVSYVFVLPLVTSSLISVDLTGRIAVTGILVAPFGIVLGMPFPSGLRWTGKKSPDNIPFMLGINGATSVVGSVLAVVIGIFAGLTCSLIAAAVCYILASLVWFSIKHIEIEEGSLQ